jgi:short-subunit dehydrogenase
MAMMAFSLSLILLSALIIPPLLRTRKRTRNLSQSHTERILVLGASSGIGKEIALQYASSGKRICLVGRKKDQLEEAAEECKGLGVESVVSFVGDISSVEDMLRLREVLESGKCVC